MTLNMSRTAAMSRPSFNDNDFQINDNESMSLQKIRQSVFGLQQFPEGRLLRWLRACNGDVNQTSMALRKHLIFRKAWQLDELPRWKMPAVLDKYLGYGYCGPDNDGGPVLVSPFGNQDVEGIFKSCQSQEYIKFCLMVIERGMQKCEQLAANTGRPYEQMTIVFDLEHMTFEHFNCKPFAATFLTLIAVYQEHYPLLLKKIYLINAPSMAQYTYKVLLPFLSDETKQLVEIPGDNWLDQISEKIPLDNWPAVLGGGLEHPEDFNHFHHANSVCQECRVPESYYVDWGSNDKEDFHEEITVYPGYKHLVEVDVDVPGSRLLWSYATLTEDIGFAVYYDLRGSEGGQSGGATRTTSSDLTSVYPSIRLECSVVPVTGSIVCDAPGKYVIEFDNTYSWFSAKELRYTIDVIEP